MLAAETAEAPPPPPAPAPEAPPQPTPPAAEPVRAGAWNLEDLQRLVDTATDASPAQLEEWRTYLFFLREHATPDGALPRSLDALINGVFAELRDRRPPPSSV